MRRRTAVFHLTILLMISNMALSQDLEIIPLNDNWKFREYNMDAFKEATVPGNVFLDLMKLGLIPDPFFRDNEKLVQDVGMKEWEYIKTFKVDSSILKHKRIDMSFKGLDTYARVYINDSLAIRGANQFLEWFVDCRARLKYGDNTIRIHFLSPEKESERRYNKLRYKLPEGPRVMTRKAAHHFGWDWSPRLLTTGIPKSVELRLWDTLYILGIQYKLTHLDDSIARFRAEFVINSLAPAQAEFAVEADGKEVVRRGAELRQGASIVIVDFQIKNPKLWWSNGLGEAYLYNFIGRVFINTEQKAIHTCRYGIKKLEIVTNRDSIGESFYFKLNGVPVFMKGANYVPPDNFMTRVGEETYRRIISDAKKANMNMLRVWGGGNYENDLFYDLCDENGILIWHDFMFANGIYPADKESLNNIRSEVIQQIVRLRNHPCMALWCGNNECDEGWFNWGWQQQYGINKEDSLEIWKGHQKIFSETLPQSVIRYDSARIYIPTSPRHGWGRPESLTSGDSHYWGVWWGQEPISYYRKKVGRFMSEYGMQSFPNIKTIEAFTEIADRTLSSPALQQHQKHPKGFEYIKEYMERDYLLPVKFEDYVYVSQLMQAEAMKTAIEAHRRAMPNCMGSLYWQLNDCWPAISWSSVDYYGRWKASHYFIKKAFNNVILSPDTITGRLIIHAVSDLLRPVNGKLDVVAMDFKGKEIWRKSEDVQVKENTSSILMTAELKEIIQGKKEHTLLIHATLTDDIGSIAENILYLVPPKELQLPKVKITSKVNRTEGGYRVDLTSEVLAKNVYLASPLEGSFSDNYFDMIPGKTYRVEFSTDDMRSNFAETLLIRSLKDTY